MVGKQAVVWNGMGSTLSFLVLLVLEWGECRGGAFRLVERWWGYFGGGGRPARTGQTQLRRRKSGAFAASPLRRRHSHRRRSYLTSPILIVWTDPPCSRRAR